jgi:DNA-directed RNA polymerase subunit M/transcription elongation factor TFIIS
MSSCPECGAEIAYSVEEARVLTGTCEACHHVTTLLQGSVPLGSGSTGPKDEEGAAPSAAVPGLECSECGGTLTVEAAADGSIEVACPECETLARFVPEERARASRPERFRGPEPPERGGTPRGGALHARPCRQCGAPLTFTTDENGQLTGECAACGNRFTLPPRRDDFRGGGGGRGGPDRYRSRSPGRYDRPSRGRPPGGPGYRRGPYRPRDRGGNDGDDDRRRRRRSE